MQARVYVSLYISIFVTFYIYIGARPHGCWAELGNATGTKRILVLPYILKPLIYKGFFGNVFPLLRYHRFIGFLITKMNKRNSLTPPPCFIYSVDELTKTERN